MKNNSFGDFIEAWADYAARGSGHLSYPALIGCLFLSRPGISVSSRMKTTQPLRKTMARFVSDSAQCLGMEQDLLLPGRIQPKLRDDVDMVSLKDFVWDALGEMTDNTFADSTEGENYLFSLVFSDQPSGRFKHGLVNPALASFDRAFGESVSRKLQGYLNQIDDGSPYGRFELTATLFFVSLMGEQGADAVISCGLPLALDMRSFTPMVDSFAVHAKMITCGFGFTQLEVGPDGRPRDLRTWEFDDAVGEVFAGREGPEIVLVPPSGNSWAVSRKHVRVFRDDQGGYWVEDVSLNGTVLQSGGDAVLLHHAAKSLKDGDQILLAPLQEIKDGGRVYVENWENGSVLRFHVLRRHEG